MRTRNLRPGFFRNEELGQLPFEARLLFQGLWCVADCEGRLEDRPLRLKADLFPYDQVDVAALLDLLVERGLVLRYEVDGRRLLWIPTFKRHQIISKRERDAGSDLPPHPLDPSACPTSPSPPPDRTPEPSRDDPGTNPGPTREPTRAGMDNGQRTTDDGDRTRDDGGRAAARADAGAVAPPSPGPTLPELQRLWNEQLPHPPFPRWREIGADQRRAARRVRERPIDGETGWLEILRRIGNSSFCRGSNERGWVADPDFLLRVATPRKVLEGKYDDRGPPLPAPGRRGFAALPEGPPPLQDGDRTARRCLVCAEVVQHTWAGDEGWVPDPHRCLEAERSIA